MYLDRPHPSDPADPFEALGLPPRFEIDEQALQRAWLTASARLHPDRSPDPQAAARELSRVNDARTTLQDPEKRAAALLARLGGPPGSDNELPDGFLQNIMQIRLEMEEARGDEHATARHEQWAEDRRNEHMNRVAELFDRCQPDSPDPATLQQIRVELNAWRYIERMIEQLDPNDDPNTADFQP